MPIAPRAIIAPKATRSPAAIPWPRAYSQVPATAAIGVAPKKTALVQFTERAAGAHSIYLQVSHGRSRNCQRSQATPGSAVVTDVAGAQSLSRPLLATGLSEVPSPRRSDRQPERHLSRAGDRAAHRQPIR